MVDVDEDAEMKGKSKDGAKAEPAEAIIENELLKEREGTKGLL